MKELKKLLLDHTDGHNELAKQLIDKEVIFNDDLEKIFGKRQWASRADELLLDSNIKEETTEVKDNKPKLGEEPNTESQSTEEESAN